MSLIKFDSLQLKQEVDLSVPKDTNCIPKKKSRIMNKYSTYGSIYLLFGSIFFVNTVHHDAILKDRYRPNQLRTTKKPSSLNLQLNYTKQADIFTSSIIQRLSTHNQTLKPFLFYTLYLYVHVLLACKIQN